MLNWKDSNSVTNTIIMYTRCQMEKLVGGVYLFHFYFKMIQLFNQTWINTNYIRDRRATEIN